MDIFAKKVLNFLLYSLFSLLFTFNLMCSKDKGTNPSDEDPETKIKQQIVNLYYEWANKSRSHDYDGMMNLVVPGSNMAGASKVCKEQWGMGNEFYYSFNSVEVDHLEESPPDSWVRGNWTLYQSGVEPHNGGFYSGAMPIDGNYTGSNWRLDGMNWNLEINWWK